MRRATGDIGFPAWASGARVLDLMGLTDATLARAVPSGDTGAFGAYVRAQAPDAILLRFAGGRPATRYDALVLGSGVLAGHVPVDSVATYDTGARAIIWCRPGMTAPATREVLARYARARLWSPRVPDLARWEGTYRMKHPGAR